VNSYLLRWEEYGSAVSEKVYYNYFAACNVGDEGGFAPNIQSNEEGLKISHFITLKS